MIQFLVVGNADRCGYVGLIAGDVDMDAEFFSFAHRLLCYGEGCEDENASTRMVGNLVRPLQLHGSFTETTICENGGSSFRQGESNDITLKIIEKWVELICWYVKAVGCWAD